MTEFFKRGRHFTIIMPKARKIRAAINRENISVVQQAIRGFLDEIEYAKKEVEWRTGYRARGGG